MHLSFHRSCYLSLLAIHYALTISGLLTIYNACNTHTFRNTFAIHGRPALLISRIPAGNLYHRIYTLSGLCTTASTRLQLSRSLGTKLHQVRLMRIGIDQVNALNLVVLGVLCMHEMYLYYKTANRFNP